MTRPAPTTLRRALLATLLSTAPAFAQAPDAPTATPNALQPLEDQVGLLQGRLASLEEQYSESKSDLVSLKKLKLSGYVQARSTYLDASTPESRFFIRRGRLKAEYQGSVAKYLLQVDATGDGVVLKDAEVSLREPWSGQSLVTLTAGQTKVPFGYEVTQSSGDREFPERTRVVRAFINGERDRGVKAAFSWKMVRAAVGVFDGNGLQNTGFVGKDNDTEKDVIGRVGVDLKWVSAGVSGWKGLTLRPGDANGPAKFFPRQRLGLDAQAYLDLLPVGGTAVKAELIAGTTYQASNVERFGQTGLGWYALLVQNLGQHDQVAARFDFWDPATGTPTAQDGKDAAKPASSNPVSTVGLMATHWFDDVMKVSAVYEVPVVATTGQGDVAPKQNLFTLQFQAKF